MGGLAEVKTPAQAKSLDGPPHRVRMDTVAWLTRLGLYCQQISERA
jgi:hypothetical protein